MLDPARGPCSPHTLHCPLPDDPLVWQIQQSTTIQYTHVSYFTPVSTQANCIVCKDFLGIDLPPLRREKYSNYWDEKTGG